MEIYQYILLFIFISICCRVYYLFYYKKKGPTQVKTRIREGFGYYGYESIDNCLKQGYPSAFCARVPLEACISNCPVGTFEPKKFNVF